jgi:hypothetical protein
MGSLLIAAAESAAVVDALEQPLRSMPAAERSAAGKDTRSTAGTLAAGDAGENPAGAVRAHQDDLIAACGSAAREAANANAAYISRKRELDAETVRKLQSLADDKLAAERNARMAWRRARRYISELEADSDERASLLDRFPRRHADACCEWAIASERKADYQTITAWDCPLHGQTDDRPCVAGAPEV